MLERHINDAVTIATFIAAFAVVHAGAVHRRHVRADRERTNNEAQDLWQRMVALLQNAQQPAVFVDNHGTITFTNRYFLGLTGYSATEVVGRRWIDMFVDPEYREVLQRTLFNPTPREEQFPETAEYPIRTRDGRHRVMYWRRVLLRDSSGHISGVASIGEDITAKRLEQEHTAHLKRFYERILDRMDAGVIVTDALDHVVYVNDAIRRDWPSIDDDIFESSHYGVLPRPFAGLRAIYREARTSETPRTFDTLMLARADGAVRAYGGAIAPLHSETGAGGMVCTLSDVSASVEASMAIRDANDRFETLVASVPGIVWMGRVAANDPAVRCDFMSDHVRTMLGFTPDECVRDPYFWLRRVHPDDREQMMETLMRHLRTGTPFSAEYRIHAADERVVWVRDTVSVHIEEGQPVRLFGVITDITEYKRAQELSQTAREMYENERRRVAESERVARLVTGVAHEVRNPLNAIHAAIAALELDCGTNPENAPLFGVVQSQLARLVRLMKDLLTYGRPADPAAFETRALSDILTDAVIVWNETHGAARQVNVRLEGKTAALLHVEPLRFQQLLLNLLDNAAQHSPAGAEIVVHAGDTKHAVRIEVRDRGNGIRPEHLPNIFDPFFTTRRGGTGLGLTLVRTIAQEHGGSVAMRNNDDGPGCTAEIIVPRAAVPAGDESHAAEAVDR